MGFFAKIKEVKSFNGSSYVLPGMYLLEIKRCKLAKDRFGVDQFIVEFLVKESNNPERPAGSSMDWILKANKDVSLSNVKDFMTTALESYMAQNNVPHEPVDLDEKTCDELVGPNSPIVGVLVAAEAFNRKTKEGKDFTRVKWNVCKSK